jgi:hypothetical protein
MTLEGRIEDLEDIIKILIDLLKMNKLTHDFIKLELRQYHYCYDCMNHFRSCKCGEDTSSISSNNDSSSDSVDDNYTSSEYSDNDDNN